jgi:predicted phage terminase large subunit-like protein
MAIADISQLLDLQAIQAEKYKRTFKEFVKGAWHELEPDTPLLWNWHLDALCIHLQALYTRDITRLLINIAPGHAKSTIVSQMFPVWCWLNDPYSRWLCASHSLDLAIRDNRYRRRLIESEWFQDRYGHIFKFAHDQKLKSYYENDKKGYHMALAVRGSGTGKRGTHLLIDDPHNAMEGEADRKSVIEWFGKTWMSRINDQSTGPMVVVGQRLGAEDLSAHILELGGWEHVCLPEEFEPDRKSITKIGWEDPRTQEGDLLWPERFPKQVLDDLKKILGSLDYAAQFQQRPAPAEGNQFKQRWFRYFTIEDAHYQLETSEGIKRVLKSACYSFMTIDLAISLKETADYTVICVWAVTPDKDLLLIGRLRERLDNPEQQQQTALLYQQHHPRFIKVESVAYQLAMIQQLRKKGLPVREYHPVRDKVSRASTAAVYYEGGKVFHPKQAIWLQEWEDELLMFPMAAHDDQVDNASMACDELGGAMMSSEDHLRAMQRRLAVNQGREG